MRISFSKFDTGRVGFFLCLTLALCAYPAGAQALDLEVTVKDGLAEIGKDLVLEIVLLPASGTTLVADGATVDVAPVQGSPFFAAPYPVRLLPARPGDPAAGLRLEWTARIPGDTEPATVELTVVAQAATAGGSRESATWTGAVAVQFGEEWSADRISSFIQSRGYAVFMLAVFGFGVLMSLSPCIYPMIPITLAVIGAQSQEKGALHGLLMSVTYVIGMALVFAIMGALSATVFSGITAFMQSPAVLVPIALLLLLLSFSMFGAYELQAPAFLRDRFGGPGGSQRGGLIGVFAMGMVAGLIASPCVGPFLAALLLWVATTGDVVLGFFSLFTFGIGMGMLLIGVGTFPAMLGSLPESGGWMDTVKKGMGLLLVAMAFYFVRPEAVLPPTIFYPLLGATTILVAVFLGAFDNLSAEAHWWDRSRKALGLMVFTAGLYFLGGSFLSQGFVMPSPFAGVQQSSLAGDQVGLVDRAPAGTESASASRSGNPSPVLPAKVQWTKIHTGENVQAFLDGQRAAAVAAGQPVMIDFWAQWCVYCKKLDKDVWVDPAVVAEAQRFVTIKIDATAPDDQEMEAIKAALKVPGLPRVVFIDSRGEVLHSRSSGFKPAAEMLALMQSIR